MVNNIRQVLALVVLMLLSPWASADISSWQGPNFTPDDAGLTPSNSTYDGFIIPTNSTISSSEFSLAPHWTRAPDNGTYWAQDSVTDFSSGQLSGTTYLTTDGDLTLATNSSYGQMTDFELIKPQFTSWLVYGDDFWQPVNASSVSYGPGNATSGSYVAGTSGPISAGSEGYIRSHFFDIPDVVNEFVLEFDRWNSFVTGDIAELQYSLDIGASWITLDNWSGNTSGWISERYTLDNITQNKSTMGFRFYVKKSTHAINTDGLFIDSFNLSNKGETLSSWFHGNPNGSYSPFADGSLIVPVNLTGLSSPLELSYHSNWDIQGGNSDNLVVMLSQDNGSSWTIMSPLPGVPAHGIQVGTSTYNQESFGWREIQHPFPNSAANSSNASTSLLRFRVLTDNAVNFGGSTADGWEGIMIDDITIHSGVGTSNYNKKRLSNFTENNTAYTQSILGHANEWQHINWEGNNGPWYSFESFEEIQNLPSGWKIDHVRGSTPWEIGTIDNSNGYGPNSNIWPSGSKGMGINLDGIYSNHVYTHLISPSYTIPDNATARLTFSHWICTEADWDGGSIFTSIDDGITWQHFGHNLTGFYDRTSTVNPNSPFFGLGIFDGSRVTNGCGKSNVNHTFDRISGDISYLAGNEVRIRFSFFTDTYVEEDGWYIDDAGISIDRFQSTGTWTSPLIQSGDSGWAKITSLYKTPPQTEILVDVLDSNDQVIDGHSNLTMPFELKVGTWEYSELKFRVKMYTENETLTPRVSILHHGITEYIDVKTLQRYDPNLPEWVLDPSKVLANSTDYFFEVQFPYWRTHNEVHFTCEGNVSSQLSSIANRIPVLASGTIPNNAPSSIIDEGECGDYLWNSFGMSQDISLKIKIEPGEVFEWIKLEPLTMLPPNTPSIDLGSDGLEDWKWEGSFHQTNEIHSLEVDGQSINLQNANGFEQNFSQSLKFSIILPARNLSFQSWNCGDENLCYRGGLNFDTNGSNIPIISEDYKWIQNSGFSHYVTEYIFEYTAISQTYFKLYSLNYISGFKHTISMNTSISELLVNNEDLTSTLPVTISTERGGIIFDGDIVHEKSIIDTWLSLPQETYWPGLTQSAVSSHTILENSSPVESVTLHVSTSNSIDDTIAMVTLDSLDAGGRFVQNYGAGVLALDTPNSTWDGQNVTWSLTGMWMLDDSPRLYWFVAATNELGMILGPALGISGSGQHAASTNDLEIISLEAWSDNRPLHDFSNPLWPLNVKGANEIMVTGELRFSGLSGVHPKQSDADIFVELSVGGATLSSAETTYDDEGKFTAILYTPSDRNLSGEEVKITAKVTNISNSQSDTSSDVTSVFQEIRFLLDIIESEVVLLEVDAPGGNQIADGHVWHFGQDLPLIVHLVDDNGLPNKMTMHYSRSGRNWESLDFLTPVGATQAVIDLPFIDESSIPMSGEEVGWLDVYFEGLDLAGNELIGGGNSTNPMARILVEPRYSTWISGDSIGLNRIDGNLLLGNTHTFNFTVSDDNGIQSIDLMRIELSKDTDGCYIEWIPWSNEISHDVSCFIKPPRVESYQRWQANTWDVYIDFELRWDLHSTIGLESNIPSLSLFDENAPLDALFTSINVLNWSVHTGIELRIDSVNDIIAPFGDFMNGISYIHSQDILDVDIIAYHQGYDIPAHNLPFSTEYIVELIGNNGTSQYTNSLNIHGFSTNRITIDDSFYGTQIRMTASLSEVYNHTIIDDEIYFVVDRLSPTLQISGGSLVIIDSDKLQAVQVQVSVSDDYTLNSEPLEINWIHLRNGRIVQESQGSDEIPIEFQSVRSNLYSAIVNMNTSSNLQKGDSLIVWFEGTDASGRPIIGQGTSDVDPIETKIRWIEYEPELVEIVTTPYRPQIGDIIYIDTIVENIGLVDGQSNLSLVDASGKVLRQVNFTLLADEVYQYTFEIEAWKEGDLGLRLQLDGQEVTLVPISSVQERSEDDSNSQTALLSLSFLSIFIAGILLFIANTRRNNPDYFDEEE